MEVFRLKNRQNPQNYPQKNGNLEFCPYIHICMAVNCLHGHISLAWGRWIVLLLILVEVLSCISQNGSILAEKSPKSQKLPEEKWKCQILSWYMYLYGCKLLTWSYKFGLRKMKRIITNCGRSYELYKSKWKYFGWKIAKIPKITPRKIEMLNFVLIYMYLYGRKLLTWSYKFGLR